jgi:hypothetical protein
MAVIILLNLIPEPRQLREAENDGICAIRHFTEARFQSPHLPSKSVRKV